jgi:hypothetical protein
MIWGLLDESSKRANVLWSRPQADNSAPAKILTDITRLHNQPYVSSSLKVSEGLVLDMNPAHSDGWPSREDHISLQSTFVYVDIAILGVT